MNPSIKPLLGHLRHLDPPEHLYKKITSHIHSIERKRLHIRLVFQSIGTLASFALLIPVYQYASAEWMQSEFWNYLSLIFSDSTLAFTYWKELLLSLGESVPILGISALVTTVLVGISTLKASTRNFFSLQKVRLA